MAVAMASKMIPPAYAPEFLASCGWGGAEILPLAGDASFRRYFRIVQGDRTAVLMDAPPEHEDVRPFVAVAEWLASSGLTAPEIERLMLDRYIAATGNAQAFERAYWALAAQRNTRILGVFTRLWKRDNKPHYTQFQPRMWGLLERDLAQPGLEPVREWFDANVGPDHRAAPWKVAA